MNAWADSKPKRQAHSASHAMGLGGRSGLQALQRFIQASAVWGDCRQKYGGNHPILLFSNAQSFS
jgi:hypothetical protein